MQTMALVSNCPFSCADYGYCSVASADHSSAVDPPPLPEEPLPVTVSTPASMTTIAPCEDKCTENPLVCGGLTCRSLLQQYSCSEYYAPGKQFAGYCDVSCGYSDCASDRVLPSTTPSQSAATTTEATLPIPVSASAAPALTSAVPLVLAANSTTTAAGQSPLTAAEPAAVATVIDNATAVTSSLIFGANHAAANDADATSLGSASDVSDEDWDTARTVSLAIMALVLLAGVVCTLRVCGAFRCVCSQTN